MRYNAEAVSSMRAGPRPILCPRPVPSAAVRIFLIHHAGGSSLLFREWLPHFPTDWEVCLLEAPGRGRMSDIAPIDTADRVTDIFLEGVLPLLDRPFVVFGHSMGALLAYELTLHLMQRGGPLPAWLGLSARGAPRPDGGSETRNRHLMPDEALRRTIAEMGGTPDEILMDPHWWQVLKPLLRNDLRLTETWRPRPATPHLTVPLSVFGGDRDVVVTPQRLAEWSEHATRYLGLHLFSGDHFYFRSKVRAFVDQIVLDARSALRDTGR